MSYAKGVGKGTLHPSEAHAVAHTGHMHRRWWIVAGTVMVLAGLALGYLAYRGFTAGETRIINANINKTSIQNPCGPCPRLTDVCDSTDPTVCTECNSDPDCLGTDVCMGGKCRVSCQNGKSCPAGGICINETGCGTCEKDPDCPAGTFCLGGECVDCLNDSTCPGPNGACDALTHTCTTYCASGCPTGTTCDTSRNLCVQCLGNSGCSGLTPFCDTTTFTCKTCLPSDPDSCEKGTVCGSDFTCHQAVCEAPGVTASTNNKILRIQYAASGTGSDLCLAVPDKSVCPADAPENSACAAWVPCSNSDVTQWWVMYKDGAEDTVVAHVQSKANQAPTQPPSDNPDGDPAQVAGDPGDVLEVPLEPGAVYLTQHELPTQKNTPVETATGGFYITGAQAKGDGSGTTLYLSGSGTAGAASWATTPGTAFVARYVFAGDSACT